MEDKLKNDIEACVAAIFSEKEETEMRKKTEKALQEAATTIEDLTNTLGERNSDVEELEVQLSDKETKISDLESKLEAAEGEIESTKSTLAEKETALEDMKKDRAADVRMSELEEAGVAHINEASKTNQISKVREMSDEEYEVYKEELMSIRKAILDELSTATGGDDAGGDDAGGDDAGGDDAGGDDAGGDDAGGDDAGGIVQEPANIDPEKIALAALNLDVNPSNTMLEKYAGLGKAMAEAMTKKE